MLRFLRCVGQAVAAKGLKALAGLLPLGEQIYEIAEDAIDRYRKECREGCLREDVEQLVQASADQVREEARQIACDVLADRSPEEIAKLEQYLIQVPAVARQSLRRPEDPSGTSVPSHVNLLESLELGNLLPKRLPKFQPGELVPHAPQWRLVQLLGAGGFGEVWLAEHHFLEQQRAIKFCLEVAARDRLLRHEGEVVRQVMRASQGLQDDQHGIVPLVDVYLEGETPWLAYEYIDGGDLATIVRTHAEFTPESRGESSLQYLIALAKVIGHFHTLPQPIIHRDLKPANILLKLVDQKPLLRVTDFGISHVEADQGLRQATITTPRLSLGETYRGAHTPIYASPQQKRGLKADVRDDVYALGVIGWQLLLGDLGAERPAGKWRKRLAKAELSEDVLDLLESCWDDDPDERPANAALLAVRLQQATSSQTPTTFLLDPLIERVQQSYDAMLAFAKQHGKTRSWLEEHVASIDDWQAGAKQGLPEAMVMLGQCFAYGLGVKQDFAEAMSWFRKAAQAGDPTAMYYIGVLYHDGQSVKQDYAEATSWFRKAADAGHASAMNNIGVLYRHGLGVEQNYAEAMSWYSKAADAGYAEAMNNIGLLYHDGQGVKQDYAEATSWFRKAADAGHASAMNNIGWLYHAGLGVKQDYAEATSWYSKAADAGDAWAMNNIGVLYHYGQGVEQDFAEAMSRFRKAADAGNASAMNNIGLLYHYGQGVEQNYAEAMKWYRKAADAGDAWAMNNIGVLYENGQGVKQDYAEAMKWYRKAADVGDADAMFCIGALYDVGLGVEQDYAEAMKWYRKTADAGNTEAMYHIGLLYRHGLGVEQNYAEAMSWFRKAADAGYAEAMYYIGVLYHHGLGVEQDDTEATSWFRKAADAGCDEAQKML